MTGIEQLRDMAHDYTEHSWSESGKARGMLMLDIADQIERETEERSARLYDMRLGEETDVCELFGVEPVDDPLTSLRRHVESLNDTIENLRLELGEARDDAAWVREHGGLGAVKRRWECLSFYAEPVPRSYAERRIASRQRQIDESHAALRRRNELIAELNARVENQRAALDELVKSIDEMRPRLMPEGMEWLVESWPRFEDDEPVRFLDDFERYGEENGVSAVTMYSDGSFALNCRAYSKGEHVKRPAPKVLDADGAEIEVGDDLYSVKGSLKFHVSHVDRINGKIATDAMFSLDKWADPAMYTHRSPVLAADGKPLREGETVWSVKDGTEYRVGEIRDTTDDDDEPCKIIGCSNDELHIYCAYFPPDKLTHERSERTCRDCAHWQKDPTADKLGVCWFYYHEHEGQDCYAARRADVGACEEFMPRARALAERGA